MATIDIPTVEAISRESFSDKPVWLIVGLPTMVRVSKTTGKQVDYLSETLQSYYDGKVH